MLKTQKCEKSLWTEAMSNMGYTSNQCPTKDLHYVTSIETWIGRKPCVECMHVFGNIVYVMIPDKKMDKLHEKKYQIHVSHILRRYEGV